MIKKIFLSIILILLIISNAVAITEYTIEMAYKDELFIINGSKFKAQTYCFGWDVGDRVIFIEGSPLGVCSYAKLYNITKRNECRLWCE